MISFRKCLLLQIVMNSLVHMLIGELLSKSKIKRRLQECKCGWFPTKFKPLVKFKKTKNKARLGFAIKQEPGIRFCLAGETKINLYENLTIHIHFKKYIIYSREIYI